MYEDIIPSWDNGDYFHTVIILYPDNKALVDCSWGSGNDEGPTNWGMYVDKEETTWELAFFKAYELKNYYRNVIPENIISELELLDILVEHFYYDQYDSDVLIKIPNILDIWSIDTKSVIEVKITPKEIKLEMEIVESQLEWCNSLQKEGSIAEMLLVLKQIYDTIKN